MHTWWELLEKYEKELEKLSTYEDYDDFKLDEEVKRNRAREHKLL